MNNNITQTMMQTILEPACHTDHHNCANWGNVIALSETSES